MASKLTPAIFFFMLSFAATIAGWLPGRTLAPAAPQPSNTQLRSCSQRQSLDWLHGPIQWTDYVATRWRNIQIPKNKFDLLHYQFDVASWRMQSGGTPILVAAPVGVFFPTILLHSLLTAPPVWTLCGMLQLMVAGLGAWRLALRLKLGSFAAVCVGTIFLLSAANTVGLADPAAGAAMLLPWAMLAADRLMERVSPPRIAGFGIAVGLIWLCGDVGCAKLCSVSLFAFIALRHLMPGMPLRRLALSAAALLGGFATGLILASWQNVPRAAAITAGDFSSASPVGYPFAALPWGLSFFHAGVLPGLAGIVAICLALMGILSTRCGPFCKSWLGIGVLSAAALILFALPGNARLLGGPVNAHDLAGVALTLAMLAGGGVDAMLGKESNDRQNVEWMMARLASGVKYFAIAVGVVGFVGTLTALIVYRHALSAAVDPLTGWLWTFWIGAAAYGCGILLSRKTTAGFSKWRPWLWLGALIVEQLVPVVILNHGSAIADYPRGSAMPTNSKPAGAPTIAELSRLGPDGIKAIEPIASAFPRIWLARSAQALSTRSQVLERMRQSITADPRESVLLDQQIADPFDESAPPGYFKTAGFLVGAREEEISTIMDSEQAFTVLVRRGGGGWLVIGQRFDPGWQASVNGHYRPLCRAYGQLLCVPIFPGTDNVKLIYDSAPVRWGMLCSFVGLALVTLLLAMGLAPSMR